MRKTMIVLMERPSAT
ncbi:MULTISPECIES: hypothetical protein [Caulobacter]|nr:MULTISPECIES: hypothetical protein [Caulobacter]MCK5910876.1 hypothetical protein [Caulobacter sp.]HJV43786.1 hypothetical protein [Caulobacter sp.]